MTPDPVFLTLFISLYDGIRALSTPVVGLVPQPPPPTPFGFRSGVEDRSEARAEVRRV